MEKTTIKTIKANNPKKENLTNKGKKKCTKKVSNSFIKN